MGLAKINTIDGDTEALAGQHTVRAFPTIKVFKNGKVLANYRGERKAAQIRTYLLSLLS